MAEKATAVPYVPGGSSAAVAANTEYQKALEDMLTALDARKTRLFDPQLLAMAKGFAAPTKSGSFFESLGNAAGEAGTAQAEQEKENREIAQAKLGLAGQKMGLLRQQESDTMLENFLKSRGRPGFQSAGVTPGVTPGGAPAGAPGSAPATGPRGYPIAPGNPSFIDPWEYVAMGRRMDPNANVADLLKKASEMQQGQIKVTDKGTTDLTTGIHYPHPGTESRQVTLAGVPGKTFSVPENVALQLAMYYQDALNGQDPGPYQRLSKNIAEGFQATPTAGGPTAAPAGAPAQAAGAPAQAAKPGAPMTGGMPSTQDIAASAAAQAKLAEGRATTAVKSEEAWPDVEKMAKEMYNIAGRVTGAAKDSGQFIGMLDKPGVGAAIGLLLSKKFFNQDGTVDQNAFTTALRNSGIIKNINDQDIANINMIGADLARLELMYAKEYLSGQGNVTESERQIAKRLGGSLGENPLSLAKKMRLIARGSQHRIDVGEAWNKYILENEDKGGNWTKFSRTIMRQMDNDFQRKLAREFGHAPAISSQAKKEGLEKSKAIVNGLLGSK